MAHLESIGLTGSAAAGAVGALAAARAGWQRLPLIWRNNGPNAVALGLMAGAPAGGFVTAFLGTWSDGLALGAAFFAVGFVHGLDL